MDQAVEAFLGGVNTEGVEDNDLTYGGSYTLYPNRSFGIGASFEFTDSDLLEATTYSIFADVFITDNTKVGIRYLETDIDGFEDNGDELYVTASIRF